MNFIDSVLFFYIFVGLYMLIALSLLYYWNRNRMFNSVLGKPEPVSIVMPCYNEGKTIGKAIESLLQLDYPQNMIEIIVVDDKSKDDSVEIVKKYVEKYDNLRLIVNERNSGGAAEPTNIGVRAARYNYIAVADADSTPSKDALIKMIGYLQREKDVGAVTCAVLARNPKTFMQQLQSLEYTIIAWTRKLLDFVDSVYVTPGPFALYRKERLVEVGLFDTKNMTQDIEIVWRLLSHGYKARMSLDAQVYSETPSNVKGWWKQRIRWNIGGVQTLIKYKSLIFRRGMLGLFIIPFFAVSLFLGLFGMALFIYLLTRRLFVSYLSTKYSLYADIAILTFQDLSFSPSILNFFGAIMFLLGGAFTLIGLGVMKDAKHDKTKVFNILFYLIVYLTIYPVNLIVSLYKLAVGRYSW